MACVFGILNEDFESAPTHDADSDPMSDEADTMTSYEEGTLDPDDWDYEAECEDHGASRPVIAYVRKGNVGRCVTTCNVGARMDTDVRRVTQAVDTAYIHEEAWIEYREDRYWRTTPPHTHTVTRTATH